MRSSHSFHSLEAEKGPISFAFGHTHTGMIDTKSPPPPPPPRGNVSLKVRIHVSHCIKCWILVYSQRLREQERYDRLSRLLNICETV